jgi:hypothetical protein
MKLNNEELHTLYSTSNIVSTMVSSRVGLTKHVALIQVHTTSWWEKRKESRKRWRKLLKWV